MNNLVDYIKFKHFPGTPLKYIFTAAGDDLLDVVAGLLELNPAKRLNCSEVLQLPFFK